MSGAAAPESSTDPVAIPRQHADVPATVDTTVGQDGANDEAEYAELQGEVLRLEMEAVRHAMRHLQRSQAELREAIDEDKRSAEPDEELQTTLQEALDENWGVLQRQRERHDRMAEALAKQLGADPTHFKLGDAETQGAPTPASAAASAQVEAQPARAPSIPSTTTAASPSITAERTTLIAGAQARSASDVAQDDQGVFL